MENMQKTIFYNDELNDEFSKAVISPKIIDENYKYLHNNVFWDISHFFWYRVIGLPLAFFYNKIKHHLTIKNKKVLKQVKNEGFFLYGNHTQEIADALIPTLAMFPKQVYVIVHANNVSMKVLGKITPKLGAIPLPSNLKSTRNFLNCLEKRILENNCIMIYPEAHIWPYYTKIRPFGQASFRYPVKFNTPVFCLTNTYQKRIYSKKPKITCYIDGPFYLNKKLDDKENEKELRDKVYECMTARSKLSDYEFVKYEKKENI